MDSRAEQLMKALEELDLIGEELSYFLSDGDIESIYWTGLEKKKTGRLLLR